MERKVQLNCLISNTRNKPSGRRSGQHKGKNGPDSGECLLNYQAVGHLNRKHSVLEEDIPRLLQYVWRLCQFAKK